VLGPLTRLDLQHSGSVSALFRERRPKLVLVLADRADARDWLAALPKWLPAFHQAAAPRHAPTAAHPPTRAAIASQEYEDVFKFVLADPRKAGDFMRTVGLTEADAPTVVIHDTHANVVRRLEKRMTKAAVWKLAREWQGRPKDEV
jgi:hypothetical protein